MNMNKVLMQRQPDCPKPGEKLHGPPIPGHVAGEQLECVLKPIRFSMPGILSKVKNPCFRS